MNKELEKMGVKVRGQFCALGPYDFVNIMEAKDNETVMRMSIELGARGSMQLMTMAAIPISDFVNKMGMR